MLHIGVIRVPYKVHYFSPLCGNSPNPPICIWLHPCYKTCITLNNNTHQNGLWWMGSKQNQNTHTLMSVWSWLILTNNSISTHNETHMKRFWPFFAKVLLTMSVLQSVSWTLYDPLVWTALVMTQNLVCCPSRQHFST